MPRCRVEITGTVQGVGFRPFVHRLAHELTLTGLVGNDGHGVWCEVQGDDRAVEDFVERVRTDAPPLAVIDHVVVDPIPARADETAFTIADSHADGTGAAISVPPDVAPCADCLAELVAPDDRRHRYPFTCCTDCGPRYTVIRALPYDRARTAMAAFPLCAACRTEYEDPTDRRHHAQATCCPDCGPALSFLVDGAAVAGDPILLAAERIIAGEIVAVKGAGGYQLICRADDERVVAALRDRKRREEKPFALMVSDIDAARCLVELDPASEAALTGPEAPITLAPRRADAGARIAASVAPTTHLLGVMLPATPVHALLARAVGDMALVCTSGNASDEPIVIEDTQVDRLLGRIHDAVLTHDRVIERRADDAVGHVVAGQFQLLRRARGFAPRPIRLATSGPTVLAVGAELKNTVCLAVGNDAHLSVHLGDLEHPAALEAFETAVADLLTLAQAAPDIVVHDLHPDYLSTKFALAADLAPVIAVQHHHAHLASCLADNASTDRAIGVTFDGLGWGADDTLWGGEFLLGDADGYDRAAHLNTVPMPGGSAAIREPWRMAVAHLHHTFGHDVPDVPLLDRHRDDVGGVVAQCKAGRSLPTSSVGRLFDAVAALCDLGDTVTHEGQAAIALEHASRATGSRYPVQITAGSPHQIDTAALVAAVVADLQTGTDTGVIAGAFHRWMADMVVQVATAIAETHDVWTVALSGGVFQNRLLVELALPQLEDAGLSVLRHRQVPPNDGGIALGQVAIGRATDASGRYG